MGGPLALLQTGELIQLDVPARRIERSAQTVKFVLALDQGTTSSRAVVVDQSGAIRALAQREFAQIFPHPGWVEHDPHEILRSQIDAATEALGRAAITAADIAAIGITNQRETTVVWDRRSGEPICNAIVWQDRRTAPLCDELKAAGWEPVIAGKTGLLLDPYFSGTKLRWILDNVAGARARAACGELAFGTVDTWLIWKLSAGNAHFTDASNASRTLLYDIARETWDEQLLRILGVPSELLPSVGPSSGVIAETSGRLFPGGIPIAGVAGDQQAALFGQCCFREGMAKNTYGTGCFMLMNAGTHATPSRHKLLTTIAWNLEGQTSYAVEGSVFVAGALIQWLRDGLQIIRAAGDVELVANTVVDSGGVYLVPAFAGLGAPDWDPYARGAIVGLTRGTTAAHLARAALDGIAFQVCDLIDAMQQDSGIALADLRVDGGASANDLLMQIQADLLGAPVVRSRITETTALGAAYLAGLGVGYWRHRSQLELQWKPGRVFEPSMSRDRREALRIGWRKAVERAKRWSDKSH